MYRKLILILGVSGFFLTTFLPCSIAKDFAVEDYTFKWSDIQVGSVRIEFHKQKDRLGFLLSWSPHGRLSSLFLSASEAKAISKALMQADDYLQKQKKASVVKPSKDAVPVEHYRVTFSSRAGKNFKVEVDRHKAFSAIVRMNARTAMEIGKTLSKAEEMADFVNSRINL